MTARRIRVLHLVQNLNYGGMERLIHDLARLADRGRQEVHVMVMGYTGRFGQGLEGMAEIHLAGPMEPWSLLRPGRLAARIAGLAPDVVHTHSGVWRTGARAARMAGVPRVVHTEHGRRHPDPPDDRWIDRWAARSTDIVAAVSRPLAAHLRARVVRGSTAIEVVPNGVDTDAFRPRPDDGALRAALGIAPGTPVIGSVGRLERIKGYDVAIRALALLGGMRTDAPPPVLVVAGDGRERERILALTGALGVGDRVRLPGWRDDLPALHASFDLFTMSSHSEGTSVSLLEAMSAGLCPVVTDVGGNADVLGTELRQRLVPRGDPEALAAAWARALADGDARRADGATARARVVAHFSAGSMVRRYAQLYAGSSGDGAQAEATAPLPPAPSPLVPRGEGETAGDSSAEDRR